MGFDEGQITLSSDNGVYFCGQPIHGKLVFNQDKVKSFRGIYAKLKGYCKVHWTTQETRTHQGKHETHTVHHDSYEEYINHKMYIIGSESGEVELKPGHYEFPFQFILPPNCPSSFEGTVGHVRYEIKVVVDRAFKIDQEKKVAVRVISLLDLNQDPYCREPMQFEFDDTYCCCCFSRGATDTVVKLPVSGYCPGQVVKYHAVTNRATKETKDVVAEIKKGPVPGNTTRNWNVEMIVPTVDTYNLNSCQFIDITYKFKVVVSPSGCHTDTEDSKRLVIGNVPIVGFQDNIQNPLQDQMPKVIAPTVNQVYPSNTPYPCGNPGTNAYPQPNNTSYPGVSYPSQTGGNPPYLMPQNPQFPTSQNAVPQYPTVTPYPQNPHQPYPQCTPYPQNTPYSNDSQPPPYQESGSFGFTMPSPGPMRGSSPNPLPYPAPPNPYATASAPPDTQDKEKL
ncbi:unnamed protein product [Leptosia nina]|uniref:Arrestin C-terminal-like domain-containing protein n=1 Tax=Leptosia nina TaxID=320188 RepID=A0AAV1IXX6_9NEOP